MIDEKVLEALTKVAEQLTYTSMEQAEIVNQLNAMSRSIDTAIDLFNEIVKQFNERSGANDSVSSSN